MWLLMCFRERKLFGTYVSAVLFWCVLLLEAVGVLNCPKSCFCNTISKIVYCSRRNLDLIPPSVPRNTKQLNVNENQFKIGTLKRANFTKFRDLQHLYLSKCGIRAIEVGAFIDLQKLKWLDLSKNTIKDIQDFTFRGLSLEHLFLNGNNPLRLNRDTFSGMRAQGIYLQHCGLTDVPVHVLQPIVSSLKSLWLNNNNIKQLQPDSLSVLSSLEHLRLHDNPLHCNCKLDWLKEFFDKNIEIFEGAIMPGCGSPQRLHKRGFQSLTEQDFQCKPPMFNDVDLLFSNDNGVLSCSASGDPAPTLYWIKPNGDRKVFLPSLEKFAIKTDGVLNIAHGDDETSESYACVAFNDGGNVTLTLNVSWPKIEKNPLGHIFDLKGHSIDIVHTTENPEVNTAQVPAEPAGKSKNKDDQNDFALERRFTMVEFVGSVLGTFLCTLVLCFVIFCNVILRSQTANKQSKSSPGNSAGFENSYNAPGMNNQQKDLYLHHRVGLDEDIYAGIDDKNNLNQGQNNLNRHSHHFQQPPSYQHQPVTYHHSGR